MTEGWTWITGSPKWHYFVNGQSLCNRWMILRMDGCEQGNDDSPDNCKACQKKLKKRKGVE